MITTKHYIAGLWHRLQDISMVVLIIGFLLAGAVTIFALRANNLKMAELRETVYTADANGGDVETALRNLRSFVYGHMNTNLRSGSTSSEAPIQLVNRFNAVVAAEQKRVSGLNNASQVYADAQAQCERSSLPLTARAQCIQDYVTQHGNGIPQLNLPSKDFYTFDFVSPLWSPDLAGWSLILTLLFGVLIVIRLAAGLVLKVYLR
jgi:preprotein translocase subunit SecF